MARRCRPPLSHHQLAATPSRHATVSARHRHGAAHAYSGRRTINATAATRARAQQLLHTLEVARQQCPSIEEHVEAEYLPLKSFAGIYRQNRQRVGRSPTSSPSAACYARVRHADMRAPARAPQRQSFIPPHAASRLIKHGAAMPARATSHEFIDLTSCLPCCRPSPVFTRRTLSL